MSTDAGWPAMAGPPPPGYPPLGYPPPGYGPPPGMPGHAGFGYRPPAVKPGVVPLRPLSLADIFNGAVSYVRANPTATLGLTTVVVVASQLLALMLSVGPLAASGRLTPTLAGDEVSTGMLLGSTVSSLGGSVATLLASILLSGMLTVVVGRAVFGDRITIGEAWQRLRGRLWALIGFTLLEVLGAVLLFALVVGLILWVAFAAGGAAAAVIGIPLVLAALGALVYLVTVLTFTPAIIVLERAAIGGAIRRSFKLVKKDFWRILGIRALAVVVAQLIAAAVAIPFSLGGQVLAMSASSATATLSALMLISVGGAVAEIITAPFTAGVVVLQYTDGRIRSEAFDLVLQTGAGYGRWAPSESTDHLWLIHH